MEKRTRGNPAGGRGRGTRMAGRKEVARNILASPWTPSCVLNHFPVDSVVCNPIIGVSPPGKLLFYSRTTRASDVPCTAVFSLPLSRPEVMLSLSLSLVAFHFPRWFHSFPAKVGFNPVGAREFSFPIASLEPPREPPCLFRSIGLHHPPSESLRFRLPVARAGESNERTQRR